MKALTWKQPYAAMMLFGKELETRLWDTKYRGRVLITSSQKPYKDEEILQISGPYYDAITEGLEGVRPEVLKNGFAIGIGDLVDSRPMTEGDEFRAFIEYNPNLWVHEYENVKRLSKPVPWKGAQRWKNISLEDQAYLESLILH